MAHLKANPPAFTLVGLRTTYISENPAAKDLLHRVGNSDRDWSPLLESAVAHEMGHVLCDKPAENRANVAGSRIQFGTPR